MSGVLLLYDVLAFCVFQETAVQQNAGKAAGFMFLSLTAWHICSDVII